MPVCAISPSIIRLIVTTAICGPVDCVTITEWPASMVDDAPSLGQALVDANLAAVKRQLNILSSEELDAMADAESEFSASLRSYEHFNNGTPATAVMALAAINCFIRHASDSPDWHDNPVRLFCYQFREAVIASLPGYEAAVDEIRLMAA